MGQTTRDKYWMCCLAVGWVSYCTCAVLITLLTTQYSWTQNGFVATQRVAQRVTVVRVSTLYPD